MKGDASAKKGESVVMEYKSGDYFGERALIKDEPRAASVIARTEVIVVSLNRNSFKRLLGPIEDVLRRNMEVYGKFVAPSTD